MQIAPGWISARVRMIAVAALLAVMWLLPACYRMTDELVLPDAGDASQPADASEAEGESESEDGVAGQAGGAAGEAGGAAGSGGIGPFDSGTGPFDGGLGDGGPGGGFPFGR
jgi:hypothetical protein